MKTNRRTFFYSLAAISLCTGLQMPTHAQPSYPAKPISLVYTFSPGGPGDALSRMLAESMGEILGQPIVVENRTGANGTIGVTSVARSAADGYTILLTTITTAVATPLVVKDTNLAPEKILAPIARISEAPLVLLAHPSVPADDFPTFLDWARKQSSGVDVASAGATLEVSNALLAKETGISIVNINYRGASQALQALIAGDVKVFFNPPSAAMTGFIEEGRVKVLGVTTAEPSPLVAEGVPIQNHLPGYVQDINFALWAPIGTPTDVLKKLESAVQQSLAKEDLVERIQTLGTTAKFGSAEEVAEITRREVRNFNTAIETAGVKFGG